MEAHREEFSIVRMARVLNVSESGYHKWRVRTLMQPTEQELENMELLAEIKEIYYRSRGVFGSRKITRFREQKNHSDHQQQKKEKGQSQTCRKDHARERAVFQDT